MKKGGPMSPLLEALEFVLELLAGGNSLEAEEELAVIVAEMRGEK